MNGVLVSTPTLSSSFLSCFYLLSAVVGGRERCALYSPARASVIGRDGRLAGREPDGGAQGEPQGRGEGQRVGKRKSGHEPGWAGVLWGRESRATTRGGLGCCDLFATSVVHADDSWVSRDFMPSVYFRILPQATEVRRETREEKKRLAMAMRQKQLGALGMKVSTRQSAPRHFVVVTSLNES